MNINNTSILIVDDDSGTIDILTKVFKKEYNVFSALSGEEAMCLLKSRGNDISVVLLDLLMPGMSGFDVISKIKSDPALADIPIVVITAMSDSSAEIKALDMGACDMIQKPFNARVVQQRVKNVIVNRHINDVKLENMKLREQNQSQQQLQSILENMTGGVALVEYGPTPKAIYLNKSFIGFGGYTEEEYYSHCNDMFYFVHSSDVPQLLDIIQNSIDTHLPFVQEIKTNDFDGGTSWLHVQGMQIPYPESQHPVLLLHLTDITKLKASEEELRRRAEYDPLTGICNKETFFFKTSLMLGAHPETQYVIARWNIERFKVINDLFGAEVGDDILCEIAHTLRNSFSSIGTFGRLEADHFAACFPKEKLDPEKLLNHIDEALKHRNMNYSIIIDMGIYHIDDSSVPVDQMCDRANLALQTVKGKYMKHYAIYDKELRNVLIQEQEIIGEMSAAINEHQFTIYYQPVYSLSEMHATSAEALVRWVHPTKGIISPGRFIPLFEKNGFIEKLDRYVWEEVCKYQKSRAERNLPTLPISVNVSRVNLYNPNLCDDITALINKYGIDPSIFKLEITESAYTDNPGQLLSTMSKLQKNGFKILMDDFGSGYSSLNMLKDVPVDILKIDMRFLFGFESSSRAGNILTSVIRMAKWLNIPVIAEGVETKVQVDFLRSIGCDRMQGFFFSQPLPMEDFEHKLAEKVDILTPQLKLSADENDFDILFNGNQLISRLFNSVIGGIGLYELTGDKLEAIRVNDGYFDILGYNPQTLYKDASNVIDMVYEADRKFVLEACRYASSGQSAAELAIRRYRCDGTLVWLRVNVRYLGGSEERPLICLAINDITKDKENEQLMQLQAKELSQHFDFLNNLYKSIPCGIMQFSTENNIRLLAANRAACEMLGYPDEQQLKDAYLVGQTSARVDTFDFILELIDGYMKYPRKTDFEHNIILGGGGQIWIRGTLDKATSISGESVIHIIFIDITNQKLKELQAAEKSKEIERHHQFLSILYDTVPCAIIHHTIEEPPKILNHNRAARKMLGFSSGDELVRRMNENYFCTVHQDDKQYCAKLLSNLIRTGESSDYEYRIVRESDVRWIRGTVHIVRTIDGARVAQCAFMDVTTQKQAEMYRKEAYNMLDSIIKRLPVGINVFDITNRHQMKLLFSNHRTCEIFSLTHEEIIHLFDTGRAYETICGNPELVDFFFKNEGDVSGEICYSCSQRNGTPLWINFIGMIKTTEQGRRLCYSTIMDVTEKIQKNRIQLQQDEMYRILIEASKMLVFEYDPNNDLMFYSATLPDGSRREQTIKDYSKYIKESQIVHADYRNELIEKIKSACNEMTNGTYDFLGNFLGDGFHSYRAFYKSLKDDTGNIFRFIGCCYDLG